MSLSIIEPGGLNDLAQIMDNLLLPLLNAQDEQERQQCVDELLTIHVAPIVRQVLRRLGFYVSAQGINESKQDAEDLYQEAMTRIIEVLYANQRSLITIENFRGYVTRVVSNVCADYFRSRNPARARLKDGLRDLFRRRGDLVSWQDHDDTLCGFAAWRNTGRRAVSVYDVDTQMPTFLSERFPNEDVQRVPLSRIVAELFHWLGGPVQVDVLFRMLVFVLEIREQEIESLDDHIAAEFEVEFRGSTTATELYIETNEILGRVWRVVRRLAPKQRDAFVLRFEDQAGRDLFTALLTAGIVDLTDLAEGLGRSIAEVAHLWKQMPMDSETAAIQLKTSRKNIYKWRFRAIQKLKAELKS